MKDQKTITRSEAAKILGVSYGNLYQQYIKRGKLKDIPPDDDTGKKKLLLSEVKSLKQRRDARKEHIERKINKKYYTGGIPCPFDIRVILDPEDYSGLTHIFYISREAFDDLNVGARSWDEIGADDIYLEQVLDRLPIPKAKRT